jgi:hypothetical protein
MLRTTKAGRYFIAALHHKMNELNAAQNKLVKTIDGLCFLVWYFLKFYCYGYDYCVGDLLLEKHRPVDKKSHRLVTSKRCDLSLFIVTL